MRSRAARVTFGAVAWIAIGAAAFLLIRLDQQIASARASVRAFDLHARETADALADLRAAQEAYVAAGQGVAFWVPKVAATADAAARNVAGLTTAAASNEARAALGEASAAIADFTAADKRAREYLSGGQELMAADVVFTEGGEDAVSAARHIESARLSEHQALDALEARLRRQQALATGAAAAFAALVILLLVPGARARRLESEDAVGADPSMDLSIAPVRMDPPPVVAPPAPPVAMESAPAPTHAGASPVLRAAAQLCADFARVTTLDDVKELVGRAADMMDASGVVVWAGSAAGTDLRPVLTHGYGPQAVARIPTLPRSADNAAAAAYRTGTLQIVSAPAPNAGGAVVAPMVAASGCIGALSAEIRGGGETSEAVQALATIFAAQLAGVLGAEPQTGEEAAAR